MRTSRLGRPASVARLALVAVAAMLATSCAGMPDEGVFVFHDPGAAAFRGGVSKRTAARPAQTVVFRTGKQSSSDPAGDAGADGVEVHSGSVGYWTDEAGEFGGARNANEVRRRTLRTLKFSKATPIYSISAEDFALLASRLDDAGLRTLPRQRGNVPPKNRPYFMLQVGRADAEIFLRPDLDAISARMARGEISRDEAGRLAKAWGQVKIEVYNFGQSSVLSQ